MAAVARDTGVTGDVGDDAAPQHFLNFLPLPQGQGSFRPGMFHTRKYFAIVVD